MSQVSAQPIVVGIINCTPDSFHGGGRSPSTAHALQTAEAFVAAGADWLDIGGESTRPGAPAVDAAEELARVLPVIRALRDTLPLSIDTQKPAVAAAALAAGASIINDISGLAHPKMAAVTADAHATVVMHMRGTPQTMAGHTDYADITAEVRAFLVERAARARSQTVWIDPGIGFAKTPGQSLRLLADTHRLVDTGLPVFIGASRKSFIGHTLAQPHSGQRLVGSLAAVAAAWQRGARAFRVHDVAETRELLDLLVAVEQAP